MPRESLERSELGLSSFVQGDLSGSLEGGEGSVLRFFDGKQPIFLRQVRPLLKMPCKDEGIERLCGYACIE